MALGVRDSGGDKDSVLLIHGWPDDGSGIWRHPALEAGYRVICPDLLGMVRGDAPTEVERYQLSAPVSDMITRPARFRENTVSRMTMVLYGWNLQPY